MIRDRLKRLKGAYSGQKQFHQLIYALVSKFNWDYDTLMKQPIPFINILITGMKEEAKEAEKAKKKNGRKK